jgi:hypothetical protein
MAIIENRLTTISTFGTHIATDGSGIGGVPPVSYRYIPIPGNTPNWMFLTSGNSAPGGQQ